MSLRVRRHKGSDSGHAPITGLVISGVIALVAAAVIQVRAADRVGDADEGQRIDRVPPVDLLMPLPPLPRRLAADVLWIRAIQSYGFHRQTDGRFDRLPVHFDAVTRIDPTFEQAYAFGGLAIAEEGRDPDGGLALLTRGMAYLPDSWRIPFEVGFIYYVDLGDAARSAHYFDAAAERPGAPDYVKHFAAYAYLRAGRSDMARCFWTAVYEEAPTLAIRQLAADALRRLDEDEQKKVIRQSISLGIPSSESQGRNAS